MNSKIKRLLAGCSALVFMFGAVPRTSSSFLSFADEVEQEEAVQEFLVFSPTTRFNLTGGSIDNGAFNVVDGICTLAETSSPTVIPEPAAPVNSNLVFGGWVDSSNNAVTEFQENTTYYANWVYGTSGEINSYSQLQYLIYSGGSFVDVRGGGNLKTTFSNGGYNLHYKYTRSSDNANVASTISFNGNNATYHIGSGIYITPVLSFSDSKGGISSNEQENSFLKIDYIIQNRGSEEITNLGISSTADVMIGSNDRAPIYGYSADQTPVTSENKTLFSTVPNIEMHDGQGNIFSLSLSDNGDCWWGHYGSRGTNAFTGHLGSNYSTGYDSGIAYSWQDISLAPGETTARNAVFAAGDIHLFRKHSYDENGYCFGGDGCELAIDHADENVPVYQPPIYISSQYEIRNSGQLMWLAEHINNGTVSNNVDVELMCDIVVPDDERINWTPIETYSGDFDGKGFEISGMKFISDDASAKNGIYRDGGIFGTLSGAHVHDLGIVDSYFESEKGLTGSIAGNAENSTIDHVYSLADLKGRSTSGLIYNISNSSTVKNSYFAGTVDNEYKICLGCSGIFENNFYVADEPVDYSEYVADNISADDLASGMAAYKLGSGWYQLIGEDSYPKLRGEAVVYSFTVNQSCDENDPQPVAMYTNDSSKSGNVLTPDHEYDWGRMIVPATCTENEFWNKMCIHCGKETEETYERCEEGCLATGHTYDWGREITPATCTENAVWSKACVNCGEELEETFERTEEIYQATGHTYVWGNEITPRSCTENAVWSKKCCDCGEELEGTFERTETGYQATGHTYVWGSEITPRSCTENAVWTKKCRDCEEELEGTFERTGAGYQATGHSYIWGSEITPRTCTKNAVWTRKCQNCGEELEETFERTDGEYGAAGHSYDDDGHCTVCGDHAPATTGTPQVTTVPKPTTTPKASTTTTTREPFAEVTTVHDSKIEEAIEKEENQKLKIVGDMVVTPMTKDQIIAAGIDISGPDNYHCYNYSIEMEFHDEPIVFTKYEAVPVSGGGGSTHKQVSFSPAPKSDPVKVNRGESVYVPEMEATVGYYEYESQEMFIIIYGESKWLKEFYDVQLIVFNNDNETLEGCSAKLDVPDGLTLCNSTQTQYVGDLTPGGVSDIHWYLRGDKEGDYSLSALFKGTNDGDEFSYEFHTRNNLHVYAGSALKMTIEVPGYSCYGDQYNMKITLTNVSDKPIYDLENKITNIHHGYYYQKTINDHGVIMTSSGKRTLSSNGGKSIAVDELLPGQSAVTELSITDLWKSPLQENLEKSQLFMDALSLGLGSMPIAAFCASLASSCIGGITVVHILDSIVVTTLEGSTTEIPYEVIVSDFTDEFIDEHAFDFVGAVADSAIGLAPDGVQQIYYAGKYYTKQADFYYDLVKNMQADAKKVEDGTMSAEEFGRLYNLDYLKLITGAPVDVDNLKDLLSAGGISSIEIGGAKIPVTDIITIGQDIYKIFDIPEDETSVEMYITDADGNILTSSAAVTPKKMSRSLMRMSKASASEPAYEMNIVDGEYEYVDGKYIVSSDALVEIKALRANEDAVIHIVYSDGYEAEYPLLSVPEHQCTGGNYYVIAPPDTANYGTAAQYCETCGKFMNSKRIANVCTAMLSSGEIFQNVYDAASYAEENGGEYELSIFGNITLDKDLVIPENVKLVITPYAYITFTGSARIIADGNVDDYTNSTENVYENIILNYWDGRSEIIQAQYGSEVTELPDLCGECEFGGWYSDSEFTEQFKPFTAGDGNHSHIYYADIHHAFNSQGKCTVCGELKNGRDAFVKAGVSVGGEINLKFATMISDKAADENTHVVFEFPDGTTQSKYISEAVDNGDGTYTFKCSVPANKMSDVIKAQICYSDDVKGSCLEYSIKNYTDYIIAHESSFDESIVNSIKALVNFGGYVQLYSGYNTENPVNADLNMPLDDAEVVIGDEYNVVKDINSDSILIKSASLSVSDMAKINVKFALADGEDIKNYKFTIDGKTVSPVKSGDCYLVSVGRISPENYDKMYQFKAESKTDPTDYVSVKYSCFTYASSVINGSYDRTLTNTMKALYFYNRAIENYIK